MTYFQTFECSCEGHRTGCGRLRDFGKFVENEMGPKINFDDL